MDYKIFAEDLLRRKPLLEAARKAVNIEIDGLEADARPGLEGFLLDARMRLRTVERELEMIDAGMEPLSDYQKDLLLTFYSSRKKYVSEDLSEKYYKERSRIYADKREALRDFTVAVYGVEFFRMPDGEKK